MSDAVQIQDVLALCGRLQEARRSAQVNIYEDILTVHQGGIHGSSPESFSKLSDHIPSLDGLREVWVLLVIAGHAAL